MEQSRNFIVNKNVWNKNFPISHYYMLQKDNFLIDLMLNRFSCLDSWIFRVFLVPKQYKKKSKHYASDLHASLSLRNKGLCWRYKVKSNVCSHICSFIYHYKLVYYNEDYFSTYLSIYFFIFPHGFIESMSPKR